MKIVKSLEKKLWMINKLAGIYTIKNLKIKRFEQKNLALKLTSTWLLSLWVGVSISPIFETIWLKSLFADPKVHLSCLMVFKTCTSLYVNTNFEVLKFMNYSMNDLKFGFVEIDTSREINRCRLEIDRVLFRKSLWISEDGMAKFWQKKLKGKNAWKTPTMSLDRC